MFATLVILIFLGNVRSTIISFLAIPTSILFTFICMQMVGFTLNMMTLMGLSLVVGILIDDAIVVRENIYRRLELGEAPEDAAKAGTQEVSQAVIATTLTTAGCFRPRRLHEWHRGAFLYQFRPDRMFRRRLFPVGCLHNGAHALGEDLCEGCD